MPQPFVFRPGTCDEEVFRTVVDRNEYRLPDAFEPDDVLIDIGVHVGSFSHAALTRGAGRVYGFEANPENYRLALRNLEVHGDRAVLSNQAVWRSDRPVDALVFTECTHNTGGGCVWKEGTGPRVPAVAFDDLVRRVTRGGRGRVRMVKVDCEGSEYPILLTSKTLHLIDSVVGEFHEFGPDDRPHTDRIPPEAAVAGHDRYTMAVLRAALERAGFAVEVAYHPLYPQERLGLWFATRPARRAALSPWARLRRRVRALAS